ncbi:MAG: anthranilate phosphoribosyltransferase [Planctomycetota bacterium]
MISQVLQDTLAGRDPQPKALEAALEAMLRGETDDAQTAGLLVALATRPVSGALLAAGARAMRAHCVSIQPELRPLVDTCGTGGDGASTFNVSTATAFVLASAGVGVAKHGNRAVSSKVGSADVLEELGCRIELSAEAARDLLDATGFVFLHAPSFHPAMRHVAGVRRSLGVRTLFNLLGPLSNPAQAECQLLGVYDPALIQPMAEALRELGVKAALVVHCEGTDEIGLHGATVGLRLADGELEPFRLTPEDVHLERAPIEALRGGDRRRNAELLRAALSGAPGPHADVVALNAGAALHVAGLTSSVLVGVEEALALMSSGRAERALERYVESSHAAVEVTA